MLTEHLPDEHRVAGAHHQPERVFRLLRRSLLALILTVAAPEQEDNQDDERSLDNETAEPHAQAYQSTGDESHASGDEPSADNAQHTGNTEHCTLTAPSTVGEAGTHSHHEGNIRRRQWQLMVCTEGDEHRSYDKVHGSAHHVEGSLVVDKFHVIGVETAVDPLVDAHRDETCHPLHHILREAYYSPGGTAGAEHLVALVLPGEVHAGLDDVLRLLRCRHGDNHYYSGQQKVCGRCLRTRHQRGHHKGIGTLSVGIGGEVLP